MSDKNTNEPNENELNQAVENADAGDTTPEQQQQQQNQNNANTVTSTVASGAGGDTAQNSAAQQDDQSGGGTSGSAEGEEGGSGGSSEQATNASLDSSSQSQAVPSFSGSETQSTGEGTALSSGEDVGSQAIGGSESADIGGSNNNANVQQTSGGGVAQNAQTISEEEEAEVSEDSEDFDTETVSETFNVDVLADGEEAEEAAEDDFDTETSSETFDVTVNAVNDTPIIGESVDLAGVEDTTKTITYEELLGDAYDIDGNELIIESVSLVDSSLGDIVDNGDGTLTFTPAPDYFGEVDIAYSITDGTESVSTTATIDVAAVNDAPRSSGPIILTEQEDQDVTFSADDLLSTLSDIDSIDLSIVDVSYNGEDGELTNNGDGTYTFSPNENFNGQIDLSFTGSDGELTVAESIHVNIMSVNDLPEVGEPPQFSMYEDGSIQITPAQLLNGSTDVDGDILSIVDLQLADPSQGSLVVGDGGDFIFIPNENFNGDVQLNYQVFDGVEAVPHTAEVNVISVNDAATAEDQAFSVDEDGMLNFTDEDLLDGAADIDGDDLSIADVTYIGAEGIFTDHRDGTYSFAPNENFNGEVDLSFGVSDGTETTAAHIDITVNDINDAPVAGTTSYSVDEDGILTFSEDQLLANSSDVDGTVSLDSVSYSGTDGVLTDNGDGTFDFAPNENFNGEVSLDVVVIDDDGATASTTASVTVNDINDAPVAGDTAYTMLEDGSITISDAQLLANSSDLDGSVSIESVGYSGTDGIFTDNGNGTYTFSPNANFNGDIALDVVVVDDDGAKDSTTAGIDVIKVNDAPVSDDLAYSIDEDGLITFSQEQLLSQASDIDGDALTALNFSANEFASVTDNGDGTFTVTPDANFNGDIDLTFDINDGTTSIAVGIDLTVNPVNDPVIAEDDYGVGAADPMIRLEEMPEHGVMQYMHEGEWLDMQVGVEYPADTEVQYVGHEDEIQSLTRDIKVGSFDGNDDNSTFDATVSTSDWGVVNGNTAVFDADGTTITTSVSNGNLGAWNGEGHVGSGIGNESGNGLSGDESLTVEIMSDDVNQVTFSLDGLGGWFDANSEEATEVMITAYDADGNVIDVQGDFRDSGMEYDEYQFTTDVPVARFELGTEGGNGSYVVQSMTVSRTAAEDIKLTTIQGDGSETLSEIRIDLNHDTAGDPIDLTEQLIKVDESIDFALFTVEEDGAMTLNASDLLTNDFDVDGDILSVTQISATDETHGEISMDENGVISFTPDADYHGVASFEYTVTDGNGSFDTATVFINVEPDNDAATAEDKAYSVDEDGVLTITDTDLLMGASDIDGDTLTIDEVSYSGSDGVLTDNGDGTYSFAPNENFNGEVDLSYTVSDGTTTTEADIDITVNDINDAPVAGSTSYTMQEDGSITLSPDQLIANSSDVDGTVSLDSVSYTGSEGVLTHNQDGSVTFSPNENFNGDISLDIVVVDDDGTTASTTAGIDVIAVNDLPVAGDTAYTVQEDGTVYISESQLLANSSDIEGAVALDSVSYEGADGVFTDLGGGLYSFAPNENFAGDVSLNVTVVDNEGATSDATVGISVIEVNDAPIAGATSYSVDEDNVLTFSDAQLLANSSDVDGTVSIDRVAYEGSDGILVDLGGGVYSFSPNENFNGNVSLDVVVTDDDGASVNITAGIEVLAINDTPVSADLAYSIDEDGSINFSQEQLLSQASDVDDDALTANNVQGGDNVTITDNGDGTFTATPDANFNGDIDLTFDVSDGEATIEAGIDLTVNPVNDLPTTSGVSARTDEDNAITITQEQLLANAADIDGDALTASNLSAENVTITDNGDGSFTLVPDENFNEFVDVSYDVSDGSQPVAANLGLIVDPVNDAPIISADVPITIEEDGSYTITQEELLQFASDIEDHDMVAHIEDQGSETTVTGTVLDAETGNPVSGADVTLADEVGNSTPTQTDASGNYSVTGNVSGEGSVTISQDGAITNSFEVEEGTSTDGVTTAIPDIMEATDMRIVVTWGGENAVRDLDNHLWLYDTETGAELDHINYIDMNHQLGDGVVQQDVDDVNGYGPETITIPNYTEANMHYSVHNYTSRDWDVDGVDSVHVQVFVGDTLVQTFTPDLPDSNTGDHWHVFDVVDGVIVPTQHASSENGFSVTTSEDAAAHPDAVNIDDVVNGADDETANEASQETDGATDGGSEAISGEGEDSGTPIEITELSMANGTIIDNGDGTYTITPAENFNGEFEINYTVTDELGASSPAQIDVTVTAVNDDSIVADQNYSMNEDGVLTFTDADLLAGASDIDVGDVLSVADVSYDGSEGIFTDNGDGTYSFAPNENFNGHVDMSFSVSDGSSTVDADIDITVIPMNDAPVAGSTTYSVDEDQVLTFTDAQLLANSSDIENDGLSVVGVSYSGADGVLTDNGDGTYDFAPNENFNGEVSLYVTVSDGQATDATTAGITVNDINDAPVAGATSYSVDEDGVITISPEQLIANSSDVDGTVSLDSVSYTGADGILTYNEDGSVSFAPNENFNGSVSLDVVVVDDDGATASTTAGIDVIKVNDAPVSGDQAYSVDEDGSITFSQEQLLSQASDVDGDALSATNLSAGDTAIVSDNGDGTFTVTPDENFNGDIDVSFDISDGTATIQSGVDLTVNPVNDLPSADDLAYSIYEDGTLTFTDEQLLADATDIDGDALSISDVSYIGAEGVFTDNGDGTYEFAPNENFNGEVSLDFTVSDSNGGTADANIDVYVAEVNDAPVAGSTSYSVQEDGVLNFSEEQLLANSSDVDGTVSLDSVAYAGSDGVLTDLGDGHYSFAPNENFSGEVSLDVTVIDDDGAKVSTTAGIDVIEVNDPPVASSTSYTMNEDGTITISEAQLLANASDIEGCVSVTGITYDGADGIVTINPDHTITFAPNENFNGDVSIGLTVSDESGATVNTTAGIEVLAVNDAPVSGDLAYSMDEDGSITFSQEQLLSKASDIDGDDLTANNVQGGDNVVIKDNGDGTFTATPDVNFNGDIDLTFDVSDSTATIAAGIDLTVNPVNDAPNAGDVVLGAQAESVDSTQNLGEADQTGTDFSDILVGDRGDNHLDGAGGDEIIVGGQGSDTLVGGDGNDQINAEHGDDIIVGGSGDDQINGSFGTDTVVFSGNREDYEIEQTHSGGYRVTDTVEGRDGSDQITADTELFQFADGLYDQEGLISGEPISTPEGTYSGMLEDGSFTFTDEDLLENSSDIDGDDLHISDVSYPGTDGFLVNNGDDTYTFSPNENFNGDVSFDFTVSDGELTDSATASLTVEAVNDVPVAGNISYTMDEDGTLIFNDAQLLANVSDVDGDDLTIAEVAYSGTDGVFADNGDGTYSFAPNENFNGNVRLDVTVVDDDGATASTTAGIDVIAVNDAPVSGDQAYSVDEDGSITFSQEQLLAQASDIDGDALSASNLSAGDNATVVDNGDGTFTVSPDAEFNGDIDLSFDVSDGAAIVQSAIDLTVYPVNDLPVVRTEMSTTDEDTSILITQEMLMASASDIDGDDITASNLQLASGSAEATIVDNGDGTWSVTPDANFNGSLAFDFDATDGTDTVSAMHVLQVEAVNDLPDAPTIEVVGEEDQVLIIDPDFILSQTSDIDGDNITLESLTVKQPQNAQLNTQPDGSYQLITSQDWNGIFELAYQINDGTETVEGSLNVDVEPVNDAVFDTGNAHMTVMEDGAITFNADDMMDLFDDVDKDDIVLSRVVVSDGSEAEGDLTDNGDGTWTFVPTGDFAGTAELQVVATDGQTEASIDVPIYIRPVADGAVITSSHEGPLVFDEDSSGLLNLSIDLIDDSEVLSNLVMTGYPVGFTVSDGTYTFTVTEPGQMINVTNWDMSQIQMTPPEDWNGSFQVTVTATTVDYGEEGSSVVDDNTVPVGDFDITVGESMTLTLDDLLGMAENTEVQEGDDVALVHLIDGDQGTIVDNGDGAWTFTPAPDFTGEIDFAYVIERDGEYIDEQSSIAVQAPEDPQATKEAPEVDAVATTEIQEGNSLEFTDSDMLAQLSDADGDTLSIESMQLISGEGVIEEHGDGAYTFVPDEGYTGDAQVGFIASDGENSVRSHFNIAINDAPDVVSDPTSDFALQEDGSISLTTENLLDAVGAVDLDSDELSVDGVALDGVDAGTVIDNGDGSWSYWPDPDFNGEVQLNFNVSDGQSSTAANVQLTVAAENDAPVESEALEADLETNQVMNFTLEDLLSNVSDVDGDNLTVGNFQSEHASVTDNGDGTYSVATDPDFEGETSITYEVSDGSATTQASLDINVGTPAEEVDEIDMTAAPGDVLRISIPSDVSANEDLDHVIVSDLPDGASLNAGIDNGDGSYTLSGDLSQPIAVSLDGSFEGQSSISINGYDSNSQAIDGAHSEITVDVDSAYTMQDNGGNPISNDVDYNADQDLDDWTNFDGSVDFDPLADTGGMDDSNFNNNQNDMSNDLQDNF